MIAGGGGEKKETGYPDELLEVNGLNVSPEE